MNFTKNSENLEKDDLITSKILFWTWELLPIEFVAMVRGVLGVVGVVGNVLLGCSVGLQFVSFLPISQASCWSPAQNLGFFAELTNNSFHLNFDFAATRFAVFRELRGTA